MDGKTKLNAIYAVLVLIGIVSFTIENKIITFVALGALIFIGMVIESTKTKE